MTGRFVAAVDQSAGRQTPGSVTFSPDGKTLVVKYAPASFNWDSRNPMIDWSVELWDVPADRPSGGIPCAGGRPVGGLPGARRGLGLTGGGPAGRRDKGRARLPPSRPRKRLGGSHALDGDRVRSTGDVAVPPRQAARRRRKSVM